MQDIKRRGGLKTKEKSPSKLKRATTTETKPSSSALFLFTRKKNIHLQCETKTTMMIMLVNQIVASILLFLGSVVIAFGPLIALQHVFRRKKRQLRECRQSGQPKSRNPGGFRWIASCLRSKQQHSQAASVRGGFRESDSEIALHSTLEMPAILLELMRSLDGGLLLATLFLVLLPQLRTTFDSFIQIYVHGSRNGALLQQVIQPQPDNQTAVSILEAPMPFPESLIKYRYGDDRTPVSSGLLSKLSPIPLVELILCLSFFALYFAEEFVQLCLRYRKYFWACNASLVYSSADGKCELTSLDYRISKTKQFLIYCSRNTSSLSSTKTSRSLCATSEVSSPGEQLKASKVDTANVAKPDVVVSNDSLERDLDSIDQDIDQSHFQQQLYPGQPHYCSGHPISDEDQSSLQSASSSVHLPSYYWLNQPIRHCCGHQTLASHHVHKRKNQDAEIPHHVPHVLYESSSMPYGEQQQRRQQDPEDSRGIECQCCPPESVNSSSVVENPNYHLATSASSQLSASASQAATSAIFTKIFLPYTTMATSIPALYVGEGILLAVQPTPAMLWLMLAVVLLHKLVTGLLVSFELHERTTGKQRFMPVATSVLFAGLPPIAYATVLIVDAIIDSGTPPAGANSTVNPHDVTLAAFRVILFAISAATLLHLVLLIIQRNLLQFQPQFQIRKPEPEAASQCSRADSQRTYDPEIVSNPPRYGVLHHFTMYTGFILVLMGIAFLNMKHFQ